MSSVNLTGSYTEYESKFPSAREIIGAITHTVVNAKSRGKLFLATSHLGLRGGGGGEFAPRLGVGGPLWV